MERYKVVALFGEAGAGKDAILKSICAMEGTKDLLNKIISYTTRLPREKEVDGIDYNFVDVEQFAELVIDDLMLEASCFNDWMYGTAINSLVKDKVNIGVFNLDGIESLINDKRIDLYAYYIEAKPKTRLLRQLNREADPDIWEIIRRYKTDCEDFCDINFHYNILSNEDGEFNKNLKILSKDIKNIFYKND